MLGAIPRGPGLLGVITAGLWGLSGGGTRRGRGKGGLGRVGYLPRRLRSSDESNRLPSIR